MTDKLDKEAFEARKAGCGINPIFPSRWSPRAMSGLEISYDELMALFEAARWAPSSYNNQPWLFIYAKKNSEHWETFFDLLAEPNKVWAKNAAALVIVSSRKLFEHNDKPSITHSFDAGAAWMSLALEGAFRGLVAHAMQGFDYDKAREALSVPDEYTIEAAIAIGKREDRNELPEKLRDMEKPNQRKSLSEIVMEGEFRKRE